MLCLFCLDFGYVFIDEAHKIFYEDSRSVYFYKILDILKEEKEKKEVLVYFIKRIMDSNNKVLFDSLLLLLLHHCSLVLTETEEVIRLIVKQYMEIEKSTRLVLLQLLVKVSLLDKENPRVKKMLDYVLELNSRDIDVEVRVQARNIKAVMNNE